MKDKPKRKTKKTSRSWDFKKIPDEQFKKMQAEIENYNKTSDYANDPSEVGLTGEELIKIATAKRLQSEKK